MRGLAISTVRRRPMLIPIVIVGLMAGAFSPFQPNRVPDLGNNLIVHGPRRAFAGAAPSLATATAVVEDYWTSEPEAKYALLSENYKKDLRRLGISTASQYEAAIRESERTWGKRTYQSTKRFGASAAQVTLLLAWEQEGYRGVMTYIFDLVLENGRWRIEHIAH